MNKNKKLSPVKVEKKPKSQKRIKKDFLKPGGADKLIMIVFFVITAVYGGLCFYLFYNQSLQGTGYVYAFESDLPYHISMVVDDGWYYSLTAFIYLALYKLAQGGTVLIAVFLALTAAATIIATWKLLELLLDGEKLPAMGGALALNFVMPFFIKWAGMYRYVSYQSGNVWHNSTYICMRLLAVIFLYFYIRYEKDYAEKGLGIKRWLILAVLLALTTFVKPSFLTVFAPALAIKLLADLISKKTKFLRALIMGLIVVPSLGVMFWQNSILFGEDTENGYRISFMETFSLHADHPKVTVILSLAFPIAVAIAEIVTIVKVLIERNRAKTGGEITPDFGPTAIKDGSYIFSGIMAVIGFALAILLIETGSRSRDGNFLWGYSIALFILYLTSYKRWFMYLREKKWISCALCGAVFVYQIICGAIFFTRLFSGESYFMIG